MPALFGLGLCGLYQDVRNLSMPIGYTPTLPSSSAAFYALEQSCSMNVRAFKASYALGFRLVLSPRIGVAGRPASRRRLTLPLDMSDVVAVSPHLRDHNAF